MKDKNKREKDGFSLNETGVYLYGRRTAVIDGAAEIYEYTDNSVVFRLGRGGAYLTVYGRSLTVRVAGRNVSEVSGHVDGVRFGDGNA